MIAQLLCTLILTLLYAFFNRLRGTTSAETIRLLSLPEPIKTINRMKDYLPKVAIYCWMAALAALGAFVLGCSPATALMVLLALSAGHILGFSCGWGKYFPFSVKNTANEKEVGLVDWLTNKLVGEYTETSDLVFERKWRTVAMSLRFGLFFAPGIILAGVALSNPLAVIALLGMFAVGKIYDIANDGAKAEWITGAYMGLLYGLFII